MTDDPPARHLLGLRARTSVAFAGLALVLSVSLSFMTYQLTRRYLIAKRESLATQQAVVNARTAATLLARPTADPAAVLLKLSEAGGSQSVLRIGGQWYATSSDVGRGAVPPDLQSMQGGRTERQVVTIGGNPAIVVAVPIGPDVGVYYEVFVLSELRTTLRTLALVLFAVAAVTTLLGALLGRLASRRVLLPVETMAAAAVSIAGGHRETRLSATDADLAPFVESFNGMVDALQERIDREARFASDVSHELRTPLTAIRTAIDVLDRRVDGEARPALEILRRQTYRFEHLVLDLLEISRFGSDERTLTLDDVRPAEFVGELLRRTGNGGVPVVVDPSAPPTVRLDRRRIERVLTNVLDNAEHYAGGATRVLVSGTPDALRIGVDDAGPGIEEWERELVFERFHRGDASRVTTAPGTGLGLAIAAEHCRVHGGRLSVVDSTEGGASFVIELPLTAP
jgi:two-component system sensor histidine kinase MtrB